MGKATKQVKDLALHPKNPRKISKERLQLLGRSMLEFGDISGIVFKCYGIEIDPHYCDIIVARWEKYTGQKSKLLGSAVKTKTKTKKKRRIEPS